MRGNYDREEGRAVACGRCGTLHRGDNTVLRDDGTRVCIGCEAWLTNNPEDDVPEYEEYERVALSDIPEHTNALLTRDTGGVRIEACWLPIVELAGIAVTNGDYQRWVSVEPENLLDAFNHPALYLGPNRCEELGLR